MDITVQKRSYFNDTLSKSVATPFLIMEEELESGDTYLADTSADKSACDGTKGWRG